MADAPSKEPQDKKALTQEEIDAAMTDAWLSSEAKTSSAPLNPLIGAGTGAAVSAIAGHAADSGFSSVEKHRLGLAAQQQALDTQLANAARQSRNSEADQIRHLEESLRRRGGMPAYMGGITGSDALTTRELDPPTQALGQESVGRVTEAARAGERLLPGSRFIATPGSLVVAPEQHYEERNQNVRQDEEAFHRARIRAAEQVRLDRELASIRAGTPITAPSAAGTGKAFLRGVGVPAKAVGRAGIGARGGQNITSAWNEDGNTTGNLLNYVTGGAEVLAGAIPGKAKIIPAAIGAAGELLKKHFNDAAAERKAAGGSVQHFDRGGVAKKAGQELIGKGVDTLMPAIKTLAEKFKYDPVKVGNAYPDRLPGVLEWDPKKNKEFMAKQLSPEALAVQKARRAAQTQIDAGNYAPFFDVSKRDYVDPTNYPLAGRTLTTVVPKTKASIDKYEALANNPESLDRLRAAYKAGSDKPLAKDWYAMKQLEDEFIKELGPEEGRRQFKARFADSMAATTGGADPKSNLMMATFANFQNAANKTIPTESYNLPFPIGGRFAGGNMRQAIALDSLGEIPVTNPKRHNFSADFLGHRDRPTIDEQMSGLWQKGLKTPKGPSYGTYEAALNKLAAEAGVHPVNFQDVAWAGAKNYAGKPMMSEINEMIERTHQITGLPKAEVLKGFIRADRPMYSAAPIGAGGLGALSAEDEVSE